MHLSEKEKEEFRQEGKQYKTLVDGINPSLVVYRRRIEGLERELSDAMPKTPKGEIFCSRCNVKSMAYDQTITLGNADKIKVYRCELCGDKTSVD